MLLVYRTLFDLLLTDLFNFFDKASRTCHVASPSRGGTLNRRARLTDGSSRFFCMSDKLVAATCSKISPSLPTSLSATVSEISGQRTADGNGRRIPSAIITGTHPSATDSTSLGLHGAQPRGHRQKTERAISDW